MLGRDTDMHELAQGLARLQETIRDYELRYGREPGSVALLAVSKGHPSSAIAGACAAEIGRASCRERV